MRRNAVAPVVDNLARCPEITGKLRRCRAVSLDHFVFRQHGISVHRECTASQPTMPSRYTGGVRQITRMQVGTRLKRAREDANLGQQAAAEALGFSGKSSLSALERGANNPTAEAIAAMADLYDVSADYLLGRQDKMRPDYRGLSKRHIAAAQTLASLPDPLRENFLRVIEELHAASSVLKYIAAPQAGPADQQRINTILEEAQAEYRKTHRS